MTLTFGLRQAMVMTHTHVKN